MDSDTIEVRVASFVSSTTRTHDYYIRIDNITTNKCAQVSVNISDTMIKTVPPQMIAEIITQRALRQIGVI
jgi:hypothetical protein